MGDVKSITLSRLLLDLNMELGDIDVIKIDVEGGELAILAALAESSSQLRSDAVIIAEITSYWVDREELRRILGALHEKGFTFYRIRNAYGPLFYLRWDEPDKVLEPKNWTELLNGKNDVVITKRRLDEL